jgi:hypothetical protein
MPLCELKFLVFLIGHFCRCPAVIGEKNRQKPVEFFLHDEVENSLKLKLIKTVN